jgi:predicted AAA+ superfamily ATPase
VFVANSVK